MLRPVGTRLLAPVARQTHRQGSTEEEIGEKITELTVFEYSQKILDKVPTFEQHSSVAGGEKRRICALTSLEIAGRLERINRHRSRRTKVL